MSQDAATLSLSLISHTNVGKTTLARTLLRRDVGEVLDQAHVTEQSDPHPLIEAENGERVLLWDTPGFGDSVRLLRRLEGQSNPLGWLLGQVWDRIADRPLWCSQRAVENVREEADVVLYLVSAAEDPSMAGYVDPEMRILAWIGRPVIVLLNQTGAPSGPVARRAEEERWRAQLAAHPIVHDVVSLDAFTRCWVQEGFLLERIRDHVPPERRPLMDRLVTAWTERNLEVFRAAMDLLAGLLARAASDREPLAEGWLNQLERRRATRELSGRLESSIRAATAELIALHGVEGEGAAAIGARLEDVTAPGERPDPWRASVLGGIAGGALGGLAADLAHGGLTLGGGMIGGALLGAMGLGGLAWGYQMLGEESEPRVVWAPEYLDRALRDALLRYLSAAHAGRGGGEWRQREHPTFWREAVEAALSRRRRECLEVWLVARGEDPEKGEARAQELLAPLLEAAAREVLLVFYPEARRVLDPPD